MVGRVLVCLGLALTASLATAATASAASYAGGGVDDERVSVSFERKQGEVRDFTVRRARFLCTDGERFRGGTQAGTMKVR
ncbi:MAG TPA: hypothetical protein VGR10_07785, partial [Thermoleophilaceae bacterium]|nr:hypothetical protein [Thermoleophilaceae bacterium]